MTAKNVEARHRQFLHLGVLTTCDRYSVNGIPVDIPSSGIFRVSVANWLCACVSLRRSRNIKAKARKASSAWSALNQNTEGIRWRNSFQRPFLIARGYRAIAQFSGLGGPFMTGTRVAEFVRMHQKAYRLARLNALTEVFGSMWLIGPERETGKNRGLRRLRIACLLRPWFPRRQRRAPFLVQNMVSTWRRRQAPR